MSDKKPLSEMPDSEWREVAAILPYVLREAVARGFVIVDGNVCVGLWSPEREKISQEIVEIVRRVGDRSWLSRLNHDERDEIERAVREAAKWMVEK